MSIRDSFKRIKNLTDSKLLNGSVYDNNQEVNTCFNAFVALIVMCYRSTN